LDYQHLNDYAGAVASLQKELDWRPNDWPTLNNLAWFYVSGPENTHNPVKALPFAERAARQPGGARFCHNTLGVVYYRLGRIDSAIVQFEWSLRNGKEADASYDLLFLAMCYARLGDAAKARECYESAIRSIDDHRAEISELSLAELKRFRAEADKTLSSIQ
jgi:tetratricopeptide (TPR) repeat protein